MQAGRREGLEIREVGISKTGGKEDSQECGGIEASR